MAGNEGRTHFGLLAPPAAAGIVTDNMHVSRLANGISSSAAGTSISVAPASAANSKEPCRSHLCMWPGCGKGFASRWALERHVHNHQQAEDEAEDADSFVERRLRERLRSMEQTLERTRERLGHSRKQEEQAETDLVEAKRLTASQNREIDELEQANAALAQQLASSRPHRARELMAAAPHAFGNVV